MLFYEDYYGVIEGRFIDMGAVMRNPETISYIRAGKKSFLFERQKKKKNGFIGEIRFTALSSRKSDT